VFLELSEDSTSSCTKIRNQLDLVVRVGMRLCKGAEKNKTDIMRGLKAILFPLNN